MWPFSRPELRIVMVCTANVCRSPAAEALLRHHLNQRGLAKRVAVSSAGTSVGAPGRKPDPRVVAILGEMGVSAKGIRARAIFAKTVAAASDIYVMEYAHQEVVVERFPEAALKLRRLDGDSEDISDPYFSNKAAVRATVNQINELTQELATSLLEALGPEDYT